MSAMDVSSNAALSWVLPGSLTCGCLARCRPGGSPNAHRPEHQQAGQIFHDQVVELLLALARLEVLHAVQGRDHLGAGHVILRELKENEPQIDELSFEATAELGLGQVVV